MAFVTDLASYSHMASEENHPQFGQGFMNGRGGKNGVRPSKKKAKQKKIPQRGLGVAQLERIRLEEQQKKEAGSSSSLTLPLPTDLTPLSSQYNPCLPIPSFNLYNIHSDPTVPSAVLYAVGDFNTQSISLDSPQTWDEMWPNNLGTERFPSEPMFAIGFPSYGEPLKRGSSFSAAKPPSNQQDLEQLSPTVNVSSTHSSSSGVNLQIEPPSNQIYLSNTTTAWPKDEKMVGMKRPLSCSLESSPGNPAAFQWSTVSPFAPYLSRYSDCTCWSEISKYDSGSTASRDSRGPSSSRVQLGDSDPVNYGESNEALDGGFLTLGPPADPENPKSQQQLTWTSPGLQGEHLFYSSHGNMEGITIRANGSIQAQSPSPPLWSVLQSRQPICYSFLPLGPLSNCDVQSERMGDGLKSVDLSLKL